MISNLKDVKKNELEKVCNKLIEIDKTKNYLEFYSYLKTTEIPFIPCGEKKTQSIYKGCFEVLHRLGEVSIPVSVALSMHYYMLASIATYPLSIKSKQYWKREVLLKKIKKERLLIANTGSVRTFNGSEVNKSITAYKENDEFVVSGEAPYMSLSGVADYLVFTAELLDQSKAVFLVPLNNEKIKFRDSPFGELMEGSFTKSVKFENLIVNSDNVIQLNNSDDSYNESLIYQRSWFQALVPSPYLGATNRVIRHLKEFSHKKMKHDKKLSESDFFSHDLGELIIKYKSALQLCESAGNSLSEYKKGEQESLKRVFEASVIAKYFSTHYSEEIVTKARYMMGSQFLAPNSITNKVFKEIIFGVLQPMTDIDIKEYFSKSNKTK